MFERIAIVTATLLRVESAHGLLLPYNFTYVDRSQALRRTTLPPAQLWLALSSILFVIRNNSKPHPQRASLSHKTCV